jgi:Cd2+/Zn2+-exporting ATPase
MDLVRTHPGSAVPAGPASLKPPPEMPAENSPSAQLSAPAHAHPHGPGCCHGHAHGHAHELATAAGHQPAAAALQPPVVVTEPPDQQRIWVPDMDCEVEAHEIRALLEPMADIHALQIDLSQRLLRLHASRDTAEQACARIQRAGLRAQLLTQHSAAASAPQAAAQPGVLRLGAALALALAAELLHLLAPQGQPWLLLGLGVSAAAIALAGFEVYRKGLLALRHGRLNINTLMTVAVSGAVLIGQWPEAAMVMALFAISEALESRAAERARGAIRSLLGQQQQQALVWQGEENWLTRELDAVAIDDIIRCKPGERIALDGLVVAGHSTVDQATITGESLPQDAQPGTKVYAGSINLNASLDIRVSSRTGHNLIDRIIAAVEQAQQSRAPMQRSIDRLARIYTPTVFVLALAVAVLPPLLLGWGWLDAVYKALVLLVIACPCALVLATPISIVSALTAAARRGILIKGGAHLENLRRLRVLALDKTGTLTRGQPTLVAQQPIDAGLADERLTLQTAQALAAQSDHPVSLAIAHGLQQQLEPVDHWLALRDFKALPGRGVQADINGVTHVLGNHRLLVELGLSHPALLPLLAEHEQRGRTVTLLGRLGPTAGVLALLAVADTLKPGSQTAIEQLEQLGVSTVILSGDNALTVAAIAAQAGVHQARGELLPEHKQAALADLQRQYGLTGMAGDGINDAPALAQADIGLAMGAAGSDAAIETADVVLMNDDLRHIPAAIELSRQTHAVLWQNIALALGIKAVFLLLALFGHANMWMAVFADVGASLLVVANGLRLLRAPVLAQD